MSVFNQSRSYIIRIIFVVTFLIILGQLFHLQIISSKYQRLAQENAVLKKVVYPSRGIIFDRKKKALVNNVLMYDLMVTPSEVRGVDTSYLCQLLELDTAEFRHRILEAAIKNGRYRPSAFEALLTPDKYARLEENMWRFGGGFYLQERPVRVYPFNAAAHILGYIGEADSGIIARSNGFYLPGDYVGRSGLEATYERVLMGQRGIQYWIKDNKNRLVGRFQRGEFDSAAIAGRNLNTYMDAELQQLAEKLMSNKVGAIVAIEPKTGGIIAMASGPNFNPNELSGASFKKLYGKLVLNVSRPLLNRAIKGQYPAGSTYKPLEALIGLDEGVITPRSGIGCRGAYYSCRRPVRCTEKWSGHAANLRLAIAHSCNSFFSNTFRLIVDNPEIGDERLGLHRWKEYCNAFGYGHKLGIDLPGEDSGNIPDTTAYDKEYHGSWNSCTMVTLGIGQDKMLATPLQIANTMCVIANKGYYYAPHFIKHVEGETSADTVLNKYRVQHKVPIHIPDSIYEVVIDGMHGVTQVGTAAGIPKIPGVEICAKTGTAENYHRLDGGIREKLKDHSLFSCFAPMDDPKIAIAVIVENGGFGATWAGPMAYLMIEKYLNDTLRPDRLKEVERIAAANLMPDWLNREQFKTDSARAYQWFKITSDSSYIKKYIYKAPPPVKRDATVPKQRIVYLHKWEAIEPEQLKKKPATV